MMKRRRFLRRVLNDSSEPPPTKLRNANANVLKENSSVHRARAPLHSWAHNPAPLGLREPANEGFHTLMRVHGVGARESASNATVAGYQSNAFSVPDAGSQAAYITAGRTTNGKQRAGWAVGGGGGGGGGDGRWLPSGGEGGAAEAPGMPRGHRAARRPPARHVRRLASCLHEERAALNGISLSAAPSDGGALRCAKHAARASADGAATGARCAAGPLTAHCWAGLQPALVLSS